jgi:hypothetical protein
MENLKDTPWYKENAPLGKLLGYPECCINEFCEQSPEYLESRDKPSNEDIIRYKAACIDDKFTGFIPCRVHAAKIYLKELKLTDLIKNRSTEFPPFPFYGNNEF